MVVILLVHLGNTSVLVQDRFRNGTEFTGRIWRESKMLRYIESLDETLTSARSLVANLDAKSGPLLESLRETSDKARDAISQTEVLLDAAEGVLGPESATRYNLISMMDELSQAARSIRILTDYLEQHPEALVRGKGGYSE
jgi:paraquat-inducible protein B